MHDHLHGDHHHHTHEEDSNSVPNKLILKYMLDHNIQHVKDAEEFAEKLNAAGNDKAADLILQAVSNYSKGNDQMSLALEALSESEK